MRLLLAATVLLLVGFSSLLSPQDKPEPQTAKEIFVASLETLKAQEGYRFEMLATFQAGPVPVKLQVAGFFDAPDFFYLKAEGLGGTQPVEGYYKGDKGAVKDDFKRKWVPSEQATMPLARYRMRRPDELLEKLRPYAESSSLESGTGVPPVKNHGQDAHATYVIAFALPPDALTPLLKALGVPLGSVQFAPDRTKASTRCWVAKDSRLPLKLAIVLETIIGEPLTDSGEKPGGESPKEPDKGGAGKPDEKGDQGETPPDGSEDDEGEGDVAETMNLTITITAEFFDFGKPKEVELPAQVKAILGIGATETKEE